MQEVLRDFDPITPPNKVILIQYFQENLRSSIQIYLDAQSWEPDYWDKVVKKTVNAEVKVLLQPLSGMQKIDAKCF